MRVSKHPACTARFGSSPARCLSRSKSKHKLLVAHDRNLVYHFLVSCKHREYSPIQPPSDVERFQFRPRPLCRWFWESESYSHGSSSMDDLVPVVTEPVSVRSSKDLTPISDRRLPVLQ